ncbi:MAG TPA: hypothetical protein VKV20_02450 [Ktedonobacteraceae bacterium]|jgi:hypothetical protein|nr:hypothetical protein [Ktedonobacteraceae bacterium]
MPRRTTLSPISRRAFMQGLAGLAIAGCSSSIQTSSSSFQALSNVVVYYNKSSAYHLDQIATLGSSGYRPISLSIYGSPTNPRYAAVWIKRDGPDWQPFNDLNRQQTYGSRRFRQDSRRLRPR